MEGYADCYQGVHLIVFLRDAVELLGLLGALLELEVLGAGDVDEDVGEHPNGVCVAAHHHVAESDVVVGCEVRGHDAGEHGLFVELDVVEGF